MNANEFYSLGKRRSVCDLRQRTAHYAGSWLAVHLLQLGDPTLSGRFQTDLTRLARGDDENKAWAGSFAGVDVASRYQGYLDVRYEMGGRAVSIAAPRRPMVHLMSQVDAALLRARLYAWRSEEGAKAALEYLDLAASKDPSASNVMLHKAALHLEAGRNREGWAWLDRAIEPASADPQVAATAILWFASRDGAASERARLDAWAQTLRVSAQTAFRPAALGEYFVRVAGDPRSAFDSLQRSLTLDATSWRTYALIGDALGEVAENMRRDFRSIDTRTARIILLDFADRVLVSFDRDLSERAKQDLESLGVEVLLGTRVTDVDDNGLTAETPDGSIRIDANNVIWAAGVKGGPLGETLGAELDRGGDASWSARTFRSRATPTYSSPGTWPIDSTRRQAKRCPRSPKVPFRVASSSGRRLRPSSRHCEKVSRHRRERPFSTKTEAPWPSSAGTALSRKSASYGSAATSPS